MTIRLPKFTLWRAIFAAIMLIGLYATYLRIFHGLGGATNLSDRFPWGLLFRRSVRLSPGKLYACAVMMVFGFIANRLNVGITALESGSGVHYVPRWSEISITLSIVAAGFAIFRFVAANFPVFESTIQSRSRQAPVQEEPLPVG